MQAEAALIKLSQVFRQSGGQCASAVVSQTLRVGSSDQKQV